MQHRRVFPRAARRTKAKRGAGKGENKSTTVDARGWRGLEGDCQLREVAGTGSYNLRELAVGRQFLDALSEALPGRTQHARGHHATGQNDPHNAVQRIAGVRLYWALSLLARAHQSWRGAEGRTRSFRTALL